MVKTLQNTLAAASAAFIPLAVYVIAHKALAMGATIEALPLAILALGGLVYSAPSVYAWARSWAGAPAKAVGFTVILEGVMTVGTVTWLATVSLVVLMLVNALVAWTKANERQGSAFKVKRRKAKKTIARKATVA